MHSNLPALRVGCFKRTASKHVYYLWWNGSPAQVGCMRQALGPGAMGKPRGSGWRGRWEGGSGWGTHVNPWLFHFNVWQNPLQTTTKKNKSACLAPKPMAAKLNNEALATISVATLPHQAVGDPHLAVWGKRFSGLTWVGDKAWEIIIQIQLGPSHWGSGEPWI